MANLLPIYKYAWLIWSLIFPYPQQQNLLLMGVGAPSGFPNITAVSSCSGDSGAASVTSQACSTALTVSTNDLIDCWVAFSTGSAGSSISSGYPWGVMVTDNVNTGAHYIYNVATIREPNHNSKVGEFYLEGSAAGSITPTLTYSVTNTHAVIACQAIHGTLAQYAADTSDVAQSAATSTNPNSGTSITPSQANEYVSAGAFDDQGVIGGGSPTFTPGAGFTQSQTATHFISQYQIQTTATATTGPFVNSVAGGNWAAGQTAFAKNQTVSLCDAAGLITWSGSGAVNGVSPTATDLQASTLGMRAQPNVDTLGGLNPGWSTTSSAFNTYATAANKALSSSRSCVAFSGTASGTLGLSHKLNNGTGNVVLNFAPSQPKVTMGCWLQMTVSPSVDGASHTLDTLKIGGDTSLGTTDYVNLQANTNGATGTFVLEAPGSTTVTSSTTWTAGTWLFFRLEFNLQGIHHIYIYNTSGTLLETMNATGAVATGALPASFSWYSGGSDTYPLNSGFSYTGACAVDPLHGATIVP